VLHDTVSHVDRDPGEVAIVPGVVGVDAVPRGPSARRGMIRPGQPDREEASVRGIADYELGRERLETHLADRVLRLLVASR
jgi:hypothetical protein